MTDQGYDIYFSLKVRSRDVSIDTINYCNGSTQLGSTYNSEILNVKTSQMTENFSATITSYMEIEFIYGNLIL